MLRPWPITLLGVALLAGCMTAPGLLPDAAKPVNELAIASAKEDVPLVPSIGPTGTSTATTVVCTSTGCTEITTPAVKPTPYPPDYNPTSQIGGGGSTKPSGPALGRLDVPTEARPALLHMQNLLAAGKSTAEAKAEAVAMLRKAGLDPATVDRALRRLNPDMRDWVDYLIEHPEARLKPEAVDWTK